MAIKASRRLFQAPRLVGSRWRWGCSGCAPLAWPAQCNLGYLVNAYPFSHGHCRRRQMHGIHKVCSTVGVCQVPQGSQGLCLWSGPRGRGDRLHPRSVRPCPYPPAGGQNVVGCLAGRHGRRDSRVPTHLGVLGTLVAKLLPSADRRSFFDWKLEP